MPPVVYNSGTKSIKGIHDTPFKSRGNRHSVIKLILPKRRREPVGETIVDRPVISHIIDLVVEGGVQSLPDPALSVERFRNETPAVSPESSRKVEAQEHPCVFPPTVTDRHGSLSQVTAQRPPLAM